tara:strand:+ start:194 stop:727 length:534 start_codon:yes stop_codon:yes gene_type:complete
MYFNGTNANLYIDGRYVAHAVTFEFNESIQKLPIYGYKSVVWDTVLKGNKVVNGGFSVNLETDHNIEEYLTSALNDTLGTPDLKGRADFSRDFFDIKIMYMKPEFEKTLSKANTGTSSYVNDPYFKNMLKDGEYEYTAAVGIITVKHASLSRVQQSIVSDATPIIEFYEFTAKDVEY